MNGTEFVRRAKRYAKRTGQSFRFDPGQGKGSHGRLWIGGRYTTVKRGELPKGTLTTMLGQLGIDRRNF